MGHQKMSETTKRKTIRRIILIVPAAVFVLSAAIVGMCLFNERPAVQTVAAYQRAYDDTVISVADSVMNKKLYDKRLAWNPADFEEHIIPGANHAGFGDYGKQPRDNDAKISAEEQQSHTAEIILDWLNRHFSEVKTNEQ